MPNRILKESICTSENIDSLSPFQEVFFYRLMVNCDDYGRMDARPKVLSSKLFPLRDVRINQINDALRALSSAELVVLYEEEGHPFLQMKTWDRHQSIRAKKSKYPAPDDNCKQLNADEIICKQMQADASKCSRNPIQSNPIRNPNPNRNPTRAHTREESDQETAFAKFWDEYPRKESKPAARKAFDKLKPDGELLLKIIESIVRWKQTAQWQENGGQFIPYPASWLNQRKWEDEPPAAKKKILPAQDFEQRDYSGTGDDMMSDLASQMKRFKETGEVIL